MHIAIIHIDHAPRRRRRMHWIFLRHILHDPPSRSGLLPVVVTIDVAAARWILVVVHINHAPRRRRRMYWIFLRQHGPQRTKYPYHNANRMHLVPRHLYCTIPPSRPTAIEGQLRHRLRVGPIFLEAEKSQPHYNRSNNSNLCQLKSSTPNLPCQPRPRK